MQQSSFASPVADSLHKPSPTAGVAGPAQNRTMNSNPSNPKDGIKNSALISQDELARIFNTAIVSSQAETKRDLSSELQLLTQSAPFKAILNAVRQLSSVQGITERQSAEVIIETFRQMDEIWKEYVFREGLDKIRKPSR